MKWAGWLSAIACGVLLLQSPVWAERKSLLDEVIESPGFWGQMCSTPRAKRWNELPFPGYHRDWAGVTLDEKNVAKLRNHRRVVLQSVSPKLDDIAPQIVEDQRAYLEGRKIPEKAWSAEFTLQICCMILLDLNGSEDLPALLRLEASLHRTASYRAPQNDSKHRHSAYSRHVQVLSTMAGLLRNEGSPGVAGMKSPATFDRATRDRIVAAAWTLVAEGHYKGAAAMPARPDFY